MSWPTLLSSSIAAQPVREVYEDNQGAVHSSYQGYQVFMTYGFLLPIKLTVVSWSRQFLWPSCRSEKLVRSECKIQPPVMDHHGEEITHCGDTLGS